MSLKLDKMTILDAIDSGTMAVIPEGYTLEDSFAYGRLICHEVENPHGAIIEVAYQEHQHIQDLRDELLFVRMTSENVAHDAEYNELLDELEHILEGEIEDVFDYDSEPLVYLNGEPL